MIIDDKGLIRERSRAMGGIGNFNTDHLACRSSNGGVSESMLAVTRLLHLPEDCPGNHASFGCQKDLDSLGMGGIWPNRDEAKARAAVPGPVANTADISGHLSAMDASHTGVCADPFAFIKGDHQERGHKRKRDGATQIG